MIAKVRIHTTQAPLAPVQVLDQTGPFRQMMQASNRLVDMEVRDNLKKREQELDQVRQQGAAAGDVYDQANPYAEAAYDTDYQKAWESGHQEIVSINVENDFNKWLRVAADQKLSTEALKKGKLDQFKNFQNIKDTSIRMKLIARANNDVDRVNSTLRRNEAATAKANARTEAVNSLEEHVTMLETKVATGQPVTPAEYEFVNTTIGALSKTDASGANKIMAGIDERMTVAQIDNYLSENPNEEAIAALERGEAMVMNNLTGEEEPLLLERDKMKPIINKARTLLTKKMNEGKSQREAVSKQGDILNTITATGNTPDSEAIDEFNKSSTLMDEDQQMRHEVLSLEAEDIGEQVIYGRDSHDIKALMQTMDDLNVDYEALVNNPPADELGQEIYEQRQKLYEAAIKELEDYRKELNDNPWKALNLSLTEEDTQSTVMAKFEQVKKATGSVAAIAPESIISTLDEAIGVDGLDGLDQAMQIRNMIGDELFEKSVLPHLDSDLPPIYKRAMLTGENASEAAEVVRQVKEGKELLFNQDGDFKADKAVEANYKTLAYSSIGMSLGSNTEQIVSDAIDLTRYAVANGDSRDEEVIMRESLERVTFGMQFYRNDSGKVIATAADVNMPAVQATAADIESNPAEYGLADASGIDIDIVNDQIVPVMPDGYAVSNQAGNDIIIGNDGKITSVNEPYRGFHNVDWAAGYQIQPVEQDAAAVITDDPFVKAVAGDDPEAEMRLTEAAIEMSQGYVSDASRSYLNRYAIFNVEDELAPRHTNEKEAMRDAMFNAYIMSGEPATDKTGMEMSPMQAYSSMTKYLDNLEWNEPGDWHGHKVVFTTPQTQTGNILERNPPHWYDNFDQMERSSTPPTVWEAPDPEAMPSPDNVPDMMSQVEFEDNQPTIGTSIPTSVPRVNRPNPVADALRGRAPRQRDTEPRAQGAPNAPGITRPTNTNRTEKRSGRRGPKNG